MKLSRHLPIMLGAMLSVADDAGEPVEEAVSKVSIHSVDV